jgi:hypothetical protein
LFRQLDKEDFEGRDPLKFCLVPPHYKARKFDSNYMPIFVYTAREMIALDNALYSASEEVAKFKWALIMDVRPADN